LEEGEIRTKEKKDRKRASEGERVSTPEQKRRKDEDKPAKRRSDTAAEEFREVKDKRRSRHEREEEEEYYEDESPPGAARYTDTYDWERERPPVKEKHKSRLDKRR